MNVSIHLDPSSYLPIEILSHICDFLDMTSVYCFLLCNRLFRRILTQPFQRALLRYIDNVTKEDLPFAIKFNSDGIMTVNVTILLEQALNNNHQQLALYLLRIKSINLITTDASNLGSYGFFDITDNRNMRQTRIIRYSVIARLTLNDELTKSMRSKGVYAASVVSFSDYIMSLQRDLINGSRSRKDTLSKIQRCYADNDRQTYIASFIKCCVVHDCRELYTVAMEAVPTNKMVTLPLSIDIDHLTPKSYRAIKANKYPLVTIDQKIADVLNIKSIYQHPLLLIEYIRQSNDLLGHPKLVYDWSQGDSGPAFYWLLLRGVIPPINMMNMMKYAWIGPIIKELKDKRDRDGPFNKELIKSLYKT